MIPLFSDVVFIYRKPDKKKKSIFHLVRTLNLQIIDKTHQNFAGSVLNAT